MKTRWYCPALILLLFFIRLNAFAQAEAQIQIEFKLTDNTNNKSHSYKLYGVNYSVNNPYYLQDESKLVTEKSCGVNMELVQDTDEFLLKWIAGTIKNASGEITIVNMNGRKKPRKLAFTGAQIGGSSENFYSAAATDTSVQISIYVKTLAVDDILIFQQVKTN